MRRREFLSTAGIGLAGTGVLPEASTEEGRPRICPKSNRPARKLCAMRLDELTTSSWDIRLTLTCLQGLVNRSQPRLYLLQDRYDELWLEWLQERGDVDDVEWLESGQVFQRFLPEVPVMFVADERMPATINIASMLGAVYGGLVATANTIDQYGYSLNKNPDLLENGFDLREMGWTKNVQAYRWAFEKLDKALSRKAVCWLDPMTNGLRDYLVEFKIPILWATGPGDPKTSPFAEPEVEKDFAREIFMRWPPNIPCLGWPGNGVGLEDGISEEGGVDLASDSAKFQICSAWDGFSPSTSNVSVHSGTTATFPRRPAPELKLDATKVYYSMIRSDGDGWNFHRHYYRKLFDDPQHGRFPIAWHVGPTALDAIPDIIDYYFHHAAPGDYFVNALTGIGYIHEPRYAQNYPPAERERIVRDYVRLSAIYRDRLNTDALVTYSEMPPPLLEQFASTIGVKGIFANYGRTQKSKYQVETTFANLLTEAAGIPVFRAANDATGYGHTFAPAGRRKAEARLIADIRAWTPRQRPAFLHVFLANWFTHMEMGENVVRALGPEYVPVRPDQLISLYKRFKQS